jgi:hypothetical protein
MAEETSKGAAREIVARWARLFVALYSSDGPLSHDGSQGF